MSEEKTYPITATIQLADSFLTDLMCTAIEGGMSYWAEGRNTVRKGSDYESIELADSQEDDVDKEWKLLNNEVMARGCQLAIEQGFNVAQSILEQDSCNLDVNDADTIAQLGLFGEIIYG